MHRKTTPKVKSGRVQKKNRWAPSEPASGDLPLIERERPGPGFRHLLGKRDLRAFIELLPDWDELSRGLERVVLAEEEDAMGYHQPGLVAICAWEEELWWYDAHPEWEAAHCEVLEQLGVRRKRAGDHVVFEWTREQARAFQLLQVFLHELGHHHDRMTTSSQQEASRGEPFAEEYALKYQDEIWSEYARQFGI